MEYFDEFLALSLIHICALMLPGPDFALVLQQSIAHGRRYGIWTSAGVASGLSIHILYTLLGMGILITQSPTVFGVVEIIGAIYLGYIAFMLLKPHERSLQVAVSGTGQAIETVKKSFVKGFVCNIFNPKATLFFLAVFTSIVDKNTPIFVQSIYGAWMLITAFLWFLSVSVLFSHESVRSKFFKAGPWFERVTGMIILGFALKLAHSASTVFF